MLKRFFIFCYIIGLVLGCTSPKKEKPTHANNELTEAEWTLLKPQTTKGCEILLSFHADNKMVMKYKSQSFEGYYEIDAVLPNYITLNIFNKKGWGDECTVNPEYLSFYDLDTEFSYTIVGDKLYFHKSEKSIVFERVANRKI